ncbi:MAG: cytidylyltransferase domain-containing protein [Promethearchaeota archaeon]
MTKNTTQILGIIPARGGSKRLPNKNIKSLMGKPLIAWTIEQANKSRLLTKTIISTDDEKIAGIAKEFNGLVPFKRPPELAKDDTSSYDVIFHALDFFNSQGENYEIVALLEPTSPLRDDDDIDNAIRSFLENYDKFNSLISIGEIHLEHPAHAKRITNSFISPFCPETSKSTKLANTKAYFPYGVIYISKVSSLRKHNSFYQPKTMYYLIKRWQTYEVDDIFDFYCIEKIMEMRGTNK